MLTLAHVSDIHIGGSEESVQRAEAVVRHLAALPGSVDAVVVTGDIADHGAAEEYEIARDLLKPLPYPMIVCPGNHDARPEFRKVLLGEETAAEGLPVNQVLRLPDATIALCDSSIPGRPEGYLDDATLTWLDDILETSDTPVFVGMHHPPVPLGIPYVDEIALREPERLARLLLRRNRSVAALLVGHAHTAASANFAGLPVRVAPGVISTALLPTETNLRVPLSYDLPPAYSLHVFEPDGGRLITHSRPVFPAAQPR
ncbi:metallophosphoesterase [Spongiactinospora sp. TRM90649]|uniref:metallophosphoesterase n=1 Tax=Spongiactinospora sp. TRM90649 TaxID=3031114 RepID=UPI0023F655C4|nr:metallophosphoesterase [Spongiactinospora sp. TRM90649]MDF5756103.1 metallophosphoesterase [Spongiactinospora sp. TRM90649]